MVGVNVIQTTADRVLYGFRSLKLVLVFEIEWSVESLSASGQHGICDSSRMRHPKSNSNCVLRDDTQRNTTSLNACGLQSPKLARVPACLFMMGLTDFENFVHLRITSLRSR